MGLNMAIVFNFIYEGTFHSHDLRKHSEFITQLWNVQDTADILFLGDCSDVFYREQDMLVCGTGQNTSNGASVTFVP